MPQSNDRAYHTQPRIGVGVIVINKNKVLLVKRGQEPNKGFWTIPGGMVELGEKLEETAIREVSEECGIKVSNCRFLEKFEFIHKDDNNKIKYHYIVLDYICDYLTGKVTAGDDVDEAGWFEQNDLEHISTTLGTIDLLNKAFSL